MGVKSLASISESGFPSMLASEGKSSGGNWKGKRANVSKPERIGSIEECSLLGSLFRYIDNAGRETEREGGQATVKTEQTSVLL